jgi:hypothetical protein
MPFLRQDCHLHLRKPRGLSQPTRYKIVPSRFREGTIFCWKATTGFEPVMRVLQTLALPLGHVAKAKPAGQPPAGLFFRAGEEIRTLDLLLGKETFYR